LLALLSDGVALSVPVGLPLSPTAPLPVLLLILRPPLCHLQVLLMEQGVLKEFAPPKELLDDRTSMFSMLVDKSGPQAAELLRQQAAEHFAKSARH